MGWLHFMSNYEMQGQAMHQKSDKVFGLMMVLLTNCTLIIIPILVGGVWIGTKGICLVKNDGSVVTEKLVWKNLFHTSRLTLIFH